MTGDCGHILLVDDDPLAATILGAWLFEKGYRVTPAQSPAEADRLLASASFDLVLSDVCMPGNLRLQWVENLLSRENTPPVLLVTGSPDLENACHAANLPVAGFLLKPVDFPTLELILQRVLQDQRRHREFAAIVLEIIGQLNHLEGNGAIADGGLAGKLTRLAAGFGPQAGRPATGRGADEAWRAAITDTIAVLEKTKDSFRSKDLGQLRQRLTQMLAQGRKD